MKTYEVFKSNPDEVNDIDCHIEYNNGTVLQLRDVTKGLTRLEHQFIMGTVPSDVKEIVVNRWDPFMSALIYYILKPYTYIDINRTALFNELCSHVYNRDAKEPSRLYEPHLYTILHDKVFGDVVDRCKLNLTPVIKSFMDKYGLYTNVVSDIEYDNRSKFDVLNKCFVSMTNKVGFYSTTDAKQADEFRKIDVMREENLYEVFLLLGPFGMCTDLWHWEGACMTHIKMDGTKDSHSVIKEMLVHDKDKIS